MESTGCCPHGSWPRLQTNYKPKGKKIEIADTQCYHIGQGKRVLLMVSDIFGAFSGAHQAIADTFANFGYNVYLPELLTQPFEENNAKKKSMIETIKSQDYDKVKNRFKETFQFIKKNDGERIFLIGFCWGVWYALKMSAQFDSIVAICGLHPALGLEKEFGGSENQLAMKTLSPVCLLPAGNDPDNVKPGGQLIKIFQSKFGSMNIQNQEFPDMKHGWTIRGDINDQKVKRDVTKAIQICKNYFAKFQ